MDDKLILKNRLKEARGERKISQQALADMVGVSRNTISSIETGQFNPTAKLALILCIALDMKFEELFYFCSISEQRIQICTTSVCNAIAPGGKFHYN